MNEFEKREFIRNIFKRESLKKFDYLTLRFLSFNKMKEFIAFLKEDKEVLFDIMFIIRKKDYKRGEFFDLYISKTGEKGELNRILKRVFYQYNLNIDPKSSYGKLSKHSVFFEGKNALIKNSSKVTLNPKELKDDYILFLAE